jgi:hypothetical protein
MVHRPVRTWQLPKLLLQLVPEAALSMADAAARAWDISNEPGVEKENPDYDQLIACGVPEVCLARELQRCTGVSSRP